MNNKWRVVGNQEVTWRNLKQGHNETCHTMFVGRKLLSASDVITATACKLLWMYLLYTDLTNAFYAGAVCASSPLKIGP